MQRKIRHSRTVTALVAVALFCACDEAAEPDSTGEPVRAEQPEPAVDPAMEREATALLEEELATVEARLDSLPGLILSVRRTLRRHLNAEHVARASALGVRPVRDTAAIERLVESGELVRLPDSTRHWIVRELDQSLPYVTPEKLTALEELGDRFHARLAEAGLPPFRFEITSALRTGELQDALRARNRNASRGRSSHEFGTTVDIAYHEFSPPSPAEWASWQSAVAAEGEAPERLRRLLAADAAVRLDTLGDRYANHIQGELGAVLKAMQEEGRMWPLYERSQPVFHTTLASDASS